MNTTHRPDPAFLLEQAMHMPLKRLGADQEAGLYIASLPWPRAAQQQLSLGGLPTYCKPLGQWARQPEGTPRRLLMVAQAGDRQAPEQLSLKPAAKTASPTPEAQAELFARCEEPGFMWERHLLRLRWGSRSVGLAMGLRFGKEVHWWECTRMVVLEETPTCKVIEMGGAIPRELFGAEDLQRYKGYNNPFLHNHNWINGRLFARLHSNGVCEIFAHHINSRFFDDGKALEDVVPVLGIVSDASDDQIKSVQGVWDGSQQSLDLGGVRFDMTEVARLANPQQPGHVGADGKFLVLQPYEGVELYSGVYGEDVANDPFLYYSSQRIFPRGMSRTLRFTLSLNPSCSPRVVRYQAPAWWYGLCEEFSAHPLLPVSNEYDRTLAAARSWVNRAIVQHGFEDGSLPRGSGQPYPKSRGRHEAGWEGEAPLSVFMLAWRDGLESDHLNAMRAAYYFTNVCIDHAAKMVRMHGYPPNAFSLPMNRVQSSIAGWLEVGDPYLLEAAMAVVDNSHWTQKNSWPRIAVGRDAKYLRSAVMLYRYTGDEHYRQIALEGSLMAAESQRPNGSFGDQAGGTGIHQWGSYITKPWMGLMCTEGVLDYLEYCDEHPKLKACIERWAQWLMDNRFKHEAEGGVTGWSYQHDFNGQSRFFIAQSSQWTELPGQGIWHMDSLARLLGYAALQQGRGEMIDAWAESYSVRGEVGGDHGLAASGQCIPWIASRLWNATLTRDGVVINPVHFGPRTPGKAAIMTPSGRIEVAWNADGSIAAPAGVQVIEPAAAR